MRVQKQLCTLLVTILAGCSLASAQASLATISWTRTAFEAGVTYDEQDQIATSTTTCPAYGWAADSYGHSVAWTTGGANNPTPSGAVAKAVDYKGAIRSVVFNGTYPVYANKYKYDDNLIGQTTNAKVTLRLHCLDGQYPYIDFPAEKSFKIYDRVPVKEVHINPGTVAGGQPFDVEIVLTAPAQPSDTRVDLNWSGTGVNLLSSPPAHIDVSAPAISITLHVLTNSNTGGPKQVTLTAQTKGNPQQAALTITR